MIVLEEPMAKRIQKPTPQEPDGEPDTKHVRVAPDLAEMISWIVFMEKKTGKSRSIAQILDPILREDVVELFAPYQDIVRQLKAQGVTPQSTAGKKKGRKTE